MGLHRAYIAFTPRVSENEIQIICTVAKECMVRILLYSCTRRGTEILNYTSLDFFFR